MAKKPKYFTISDEQADKLRAKKVTAPKSYDPGKGRPKEHLAYLNKGEMKALRGMNGDNMERGPKGLPSFPPADAIGSSSKASSSKAPSGKSGGPSGGMMGGSGSGGSSRTAPSSGKPSGGGNVGGGKGSGTSTGWGGGSGKPSAGGAGGAGGGPKSPMSGQGSSFKSPEEARHATGRAINKSFMENTRAQNEARMATERAKSFGPRAPTSPISNTVSPSQIAAQNTLDRIAAGSVVNKNFNKMMDQVPRDPTYRSTPSQVVNLSQEPTAGPNRGLGTNLPQRTASMFEGANSPFADQGVPQYNRSLYDNQRFGTIPDAGVRKTVNQYSPPAVMAGAAYSGSPFANTPPAKTRGLSAADFGTPAVMPSGSYFSSPAAPAAPSKYQDQIVTIDGNTYYVTPERFAQLPANEQAIFNREIAANQVPRYTPAAAPVTTANVSVPRYGFTNPYAGNVAPVSTTETPAEQTVRQAQQPDMGTYSPTVQKLVDPLANWAAKKLGTDVPPSQQDSYLVRADQALANAFGTPGPNSAYAQAMSNAANRASERPAYMPPTQSYAPNATLGTTEAAAPAPALAPLPPYVNYQQLPPNYGAGYTGGVAPSPLISQYLGAGYASGGSVGDSTSFEDRLSYGLKNSPSSNPFFKLAYAIGLPVFHRGSGEDGWSQVGQDMRMAQLRRGETPAAKPATPAASQPATQPTSAAGLSQYVLPPPDERISDFNNSGILQRQNQMFRLPEKRGGGVGDGIDAAIRLAKSFA